MPPPTPTTPGDPLGILASTAPVVHNSTVVSIDQAAIGQLATRLLAERIPPPAWDAETHFTGSGSAAAEQSAGWVFALDTLNFCFWAQGSDPQHRWRISSAGITHDGYMALAIALRDAATAGTPVWDPSWMATVTDGDLHTVFVPTPGSASIPLLSQRTSNLNELGRAMLRREPSSTPFISFIRQCQASAPAIAAAVIALAPSFDDVALWSPPTGGESQVVRFHKRAQILASDLAGALAPQGLTITHRDQLTAFADYKVPQVLRHLGILTYGDDLVRRIHHRNLLAPGSREEVEIRAATIWACEWLRQALSNAATPFTASDVDWLLWNQGQHLSAGTEPYHRTVTIFY